MAFKMHGFCLQSRRLEALYMPFGKLRASVSCEEMSWVQKIGDNALLVMSKAKSYYLLIWLFT